ncbi:hypothetical protein [Halorubellus litoreus]|uniref:Halobacterial output domain-containing protein n=1 Tax=Halorubellus litoreus TaxID=755308 RepID=A0ABD5VD52_9EURY
MADLAAETLVAAHETILDCWAQEKPEQVSKLAEPVRTEPVYRPLSPSRSEEEFYQERDEYLRELTRFRVREVREIRNGHIRPESRVAVIEDTNRMAIYRGCVPDILRGAVDWPDDVIAFARDEVPKRVRRPRASRSRPEEDASDELAPPAITEILPRSILDGAARVAAVDELILYRALDDLQSRMERQFDELVAQYTVERCAVDHIAIEADERVLANALAGYSDEAREAVALAHARSYPSSTTGDGTPLHIACSPTDIYHITDVANGG